MSANAKVYVGLNLPCELIQLITNEVEGCDIEKWDKSDMAPIEAIASGAVGCHGILISSSSRITAESMNIIGPQLKVISTMSAGYEHIDMRATKERGIVIGNVSVALAAAMAEFTIGLLIAMARRMFQAEKKARMWVGSSIAKRLVAFEPSKLLYCGPSKKSKASTFDAIYVPIDQLLEESDYIIVSCSLNDTTRGLFDKNSFAKMKSCSMFINVARGGIVNHEDLYEALANKTIKAAAVDVTTPEPLPIDHPLFSIDNCIILPHIGSATLETRFAMAKLAVQNLIAGVNEKALPGQVAMI